MNSGARTRVLIIASWYPTDTNPVSGIFIRDQAEILAEHFDVAVIAPTMIGRRQLGNRHVLAAAPPQHLDRVLTRRPVAPVAYRFPSLSAWSYLRAVEGSFSELRRTWGVPHIINAHVVSPAGAAAVRLKDRYDVPVVLTEHSGPFSIHLTTPRRKAAIQHVLRSVDRVVAVGEALRDEMRLVADVKIQTVGNVVAPEFFEASLPRPRGRLELRLVAVGLLTPIKRFDLLLEAYARVALEKADLRLAIVGDGPERDNLKALADALGVASTVNFVGNATRAEVREWLNWADVLVSSSDHESFGLAIAEALAMGRPVITTASGGPQTFVDPDIGIIVPPRDVSAIADAIRAFPGFNARFRPAEARGRMDLRFGPHLFIKTMAAVYAETLASRGSTTAMPRL